MGECNLTNDSEIQAFDAQSFRITLRLWGKQNYRPYPWRQSNNPYNILIAEIMLHRTQASQVVLVYQKFIEKYPDITSVALASNADLYDALYSLGLHWRIDLFHLMADDIINRFDGKIPHEKADLLSLPGVSDYIAGAVRCFVWNLPEPLIDTNTVRVIGRIFDLQIHDSSRRSRQFRDIISNLIDPNEPAAFNYALLDLAERICMKKRQPECSICPVQKFCIYRYKQILVDKENVNG
jgi:A/G-specific adenine glycosylase